MPSLRVALEPLTRERVHPGEAAVAATIVNGGAQPEPFHRAHAERGSLVLQIEDGGGRRVLLPPPGPPDERDLAPASTLAPGEAVTFRYAGFLDSRAASGRYRVRWFTSDPALGGTRESPLTSDWVALEIVGPPGPGVRSTVRDLVTWPVRYAVGLARWLIALIARLLCRAVMEREVDHAMVEKIEDGSPPSWNQTYYWHARFHVRLDMPQQRIVVTIRLRMGGGASPVASWVTTVQNAWSNRFKDCATLGCAANGYPILLALVYVTSGEHYVMNVASGRTEHMLSWGVADGDQGHEAGHMLGNKEEYFTVDGVKYGPGRQPGGNIMNNPDNPPVAAHYWLIQRTVDDMLRINYSLAGGSTRPVNVPCSFI